MANDRYVDRISELIDASRTENNRQFGTRRKVEAVFHVVGEFVRDNGNAMLRKVLADELIESDTSGWLDSCSVLDVDYLIGEEIKKRGTEFGVFQISLVDHLQNRRKEIVI